MNRTLYAAIFALICLAEAFLTGCGGSSSSSTPPSTGGAQVVGIKATSGSSQTAPSRTAFSSPLTATVTTSGIGTGGEKVTFTAPTSGPGGTFANGTNTETDITNSFGVATSSTFTANTLGGTYSVTASVPGVSSPVSFSLTNIVTTSYSFYLSGQEASTSSYYALAGSVILDGSGNVLGGEQDYNDAGAGVSSPEPKPDQITGGSLTFPSGAPPGQAILTLNTNNSNLDNGTEIFGVQFVNPNHALIMQFDGTATSSGSLDLQTLPGTFNGSFAFALSGIDSGFSPDAYGGVFSISGTTLSSGILDVNDAIATGAVVTGTPFSGTISAPDFYERGTIKGVRVSTLPVSLAYYMVGPEVMRLIDIDAGDSALGSAFGQGTSAFPNASLGPSVFALAGNVFAQYGALGQFTTSNATSSPADFSGFGDDSEPPNGVFSPDPERISGTYSIAGNGYGSLAFSVTNINYAGLGDVTHLGIYATDPALNLEDPNNPAGGGGALSVDLDDGVSFGVVALSGLTGVVVPQTDTATADFAGNYAAAWQNFDTNGCGCEFDMIAQGTMVAGTTGSGSLSLTGLVSDPLSSLATPDLTSSGDTFVGAPLADPLRPGRYTMLTTRGSLAAVIDGVSIVPNFYMVIYQASADQLFWLDYDSINQITVSLGPLEQQSSLTGLPATKKRSTRTSPKRWR